MKRRKHVILIGEAEELRELHDEWTCRDACIAVDALFVSDEPFVDESASWQRYDWDAVEGFLRQHPEVKEVCCTSAAMRDGDLKRLCYLCEELHVRFTFVPSGISSLHRRMSVERRGGMSLLTPCRPLLCSPCWRMFKRAGDVLVLEGVFGSSLSRLWMWYCCRHRHSRLRLLRWWSPGLRAP